MAVEFYIHKMSEHMDSAEIIQWLVAEGQAVAAHQAIVEVMTDKFAVELEAPQAGILAGIRPGCGKGAVVPVGEPIAYIVQPGERVPMLPPFGDGAVGQAANTESRSDSRSGGCGRCQSSGGAWRGNRPGQIYAGSTAHGQRPWAWTSSRYMARGLVAVLSKPISAPLPSCESLRRLSRRCPLCRPQQRRHRRTIAGSASRNSRPSSALQGSGCARVW